MARGPRGAGPNAAASVKAGPEHEHNNQFLK